MRTLLTSELECVCGGVREHGIPMSSQVNPLAGSNPPRQFPILPGDGQWTPMPNGGGEITATPSSVSYRTPNLPLEDWGVYAVLSFISGSGFGVTVGATNGGTTVTLTPEGGGEFAGSLTHTSGDDTFSFGIEVDVFDNGLDMLQFNYTHQNSTDTDAVVAHRALQHSVQESRQTTR